MSKAPVAGEPPPAELVPGETLFWKMADTKGLIMRHVVTGYMVTCYRCFVWDVERNAVTASVPIGLAVTTVEGRRPGKRARRGGNFIVPQTVNYAQPAMGEPVEIGDVIFRVKGEPVMVFREVAEPLKVKALIDSLRAQVRVPAGLGVEVLWKS
jgi:hypothetical protein